MPGSTRSKKTKAVLFKTAGNLIEGYFGLCTSYKEKLVALYLVELSIQAFWLAISVATFWYCIPQTSDTLPKLMLALAFATAPWAVIGILFHPRHLKCCPNHCIRCEVCKTAVQYVINIFFVVILVWMNVVFWPQPPAPGSIRTLAMTWLISGLIWVTYTFTSPFVLYYLSSGAQEQRWPQSETTTDSPWEKDPLVQHRKFTGQEHPVDV